MIKSKTITRNKVTVKLLDGRTMRFNIVDSGSAFNLQLVCINHDSFYFEEIEEVLAELDDAGI